MSSTLNASWVPDEDAVTLYSEKCLYLGAVACGWAFGSLFVVYIMCLHAMYRSKTFRSRQNWFFVAYVNVMMLLAALYFASSTKFIQLAFIDQREIPGGPLAFFAVDYLNPINLLNSDVYLPMSWLADGMVLWRAWVVWSGSRFRFFLVLPALLFLGSIACGLIGTIASEEPGNDFLSSLSISFFIPMFALSLSLNVILTLVIVGRLVYYRNTVAKYLGAQHGAQYTSIAAMLAESAALTAAFSLLAWIPYLIEHPLTLLFIPVQSIVQVISPLLVIYRVAAGQAWTTKTGGEISSYRARSGTYRSNGSGTQASTRVAFNEYPMDQRKNMVVQLDVDRTIKTDPDMDLHSHV